MKTKDLLEKIRGIQTIETIMDLLGVNRKKAVYYIHRMRRAGYVKTRRLSNNKRLYNISFENRLKGVSYYEIINRSSPIKVASPEIYKIYGKEPTPEETLVYAIKTQSFRTILAALSLFKKIRDWTGLYHLTKKSHTRRQVGALYEVARKVMLARRMPKRFRNNALPNACVQWKEIISGLKSDDFKDIEKTWKMHIPFNKKDLEAYKK